MDGDLSNPILYVMRIKFKKVKCIIKHYRDNDIFRENFLW